MTGDLCWLAFRDDDCSDAVPTTSIVAWGYNTGLGDYAPMATVDEFDTRLSGLHVTSLDDVWWTGCPCDTIDCDTTALPLVFHRRTIGGSSRQDSARLDDLRLVP